MDVLLGFNGLDCAAGCAGQAKSLENSSTRSDSLKGCKKDVSATGDSLPVFYLCFQELYFNYSESRKTFVAYTEITFHIHVQQNSMNFAVHKIKKITLLHESAVLLSKVNII